MLRVCYGLRAVSQQGIRNLIAGGSPLAVRGWNLAYNPSLYDLLGGASGSLIKIV